MRAEIQGITNSPLINKPSIVTNDTRLAISYENATDLARSEKALLEPQLNASVYRIGSGNRKERGDGIRQLRR